MYIYIAFSFCSANEVRFDFLMKSVFNLIAQDVMWLRMTVIGNINQLAACKLLFYTFIVCTFVVWTFVVSTTQLSTWNYAIKITYVLSLCQVWPCAGSSQLLFIAHLLPRIICCTLWIRCTFNLYIYNLRKRFYLGPSLKIGWF